MTTKNKKKAKEESLIVSIAKDLKKNSLVADLSKIFESRGFHKIKGPTSTSLFVRFWNFENRILFDLHPLLIINDVNTVSVEAFKYEIYHKPNAVDGEMEGEPIHEESCLFSSLEEDLIDALDWVEEADFDSADQEINRRIFLTERFYSSNFPKILDFLSKTYPTNSIKVDEENGFVVLSKDGEGLLIDMCQDETLEVDPVSIDTSWTPVFHLGFFAGEIDVNPIFADNSLICSSFQELKREFANWIKISKSSLKEPVPSKKKGK
jgi:hypothetical protein